MSTLYITTQGATLCKQDKRLIVRHEKAVLADVPLIEVNAVVIFGRVQITAPAIAFLCWEGIEICYLTQYGTYIGRTVPRNKRNPNIRRLQYQASTDILQSAIIARAFVEGKIANMRTILVRSQRELHDEAVSPAISKIKNVEKIVATETNLDKIRGYEGEASALYFQVFDNLIRQKEFVFESRSRRPPRNAVNALLSFAYTLVANDLHSAIDTVGLDPYIGYLHADHYGRPSLAMDLMEQFRPLIADTLVLSCINKRVLSLDDFKKEFPCVVYLRDSGRKKFLDQYESKKQQEFIHPLLKIRMTYSRAFEMQTRLLVKYLEKEIPAYPSLVTR